MSETVEIYQERVEWLGGNHKNQSGKSDKVYEITVVFNRGRYIETREWGKYGAKSQTKVLEHRSEYRAVSSAKSQISKKTAKGYTRPVDALSRLASVMEDVS